MFVNYSMYRIFILFFIINLSNISSNDVALIDETKWVTHAHDNMDKSSKDDNLNGENTNFDNLINFTVEYPRDWFQIDIFKREVCLFSHVKFPKDWQDNLMIGRALPLHGKTNGSLIEIRKESVSKLLKQSRIRKSNKELVYKYNSLEEWVEDKKQIVSTPDTIIFEEENGQIVKNIQTDYNISIYNKEYYFHKIEHYNACLSVSAGMCASGDAPRGDYTSYEVYVIRDSSIYFFRTHLDMQYKDFDKKFNKMLSTFKILN